MENGMPSWSEYLKQIEAEAPVDAAPVKSTPGKQRVLVSKPKLSVEEEAKLKARREEDEKRRQQMREVKKSMRQQTQPDTTTVVVSPSKGPAKKLTVATAKSPAKSPMKPQQPQSQQGGASPFKARSAPGKTSLTSAKPRQPQQPPMTPPPVEAPKVAEAPTTPLSGGAISDNKGNVLPAWSTFAKDNNLAAAEPVPFGVKLSGVVTPSKTRTPSKSKPLPAEEEQRLALKRQAEEKRRVEMHAELAARRQQELLKSPAPGAVTVQVAVLEDAPPSPKQAVAHAKKQASAVVESTLALVGHALASMETQVRESEAAKWRIQLAELQAENAALKAASPKKLASAVGDVEALKAALAAAKGRTASAEARRVVVAAELAALRVEHEQLTALADELMAKLEAQTQLAAQPHPHPQQDKQQ